MKVLRDLGLNINEDIFISGLASSSGLIEKDQCFIALQGLRSHGLDYIDEAIANGASCVLHDKENYNEALILLNALIADKHIAPEIFFQIGNAQYKKNNIGKSILAYKRALLLNPQFKEARQNLHTLRKTNEFDEFKNTKIQIIAKKIPAKYMSFALGFS